MDNPLLEAYAVVVTQDIAWGEMDAMGHVNNAVYFRYFETARLVYIERLNNFGLVAADGIGPILAKIDCRFRLPLTYPDTISIGVRVTEIAEDRFKMQHRIVSHTHQKIAAEGVGTVVCFDYHTNRKVPFPAAVREQIDAVDAPAAFQY